MTKKHMTYYTKSLFIYQKNCSKCQSSSSQPKYTISSNNVLCHRCGKGYKGYFQTILSPSIFNHKLKTIKTAANLKRSARFSKFIPNGDYAMFKNKKQNKKKNLQKPTT